MAQPVERGDATAAGPRVVLTGGPGVGKTTLLRALADRGCTVVEESARQVIRERRAAGLPPRPAPVAFAREILRRDLAAWRRVADHPGPVFFDRCLLEALAMLQDLAAIDAAESDAVRAAHPFHPLVFLLPPWPAIYTTDAERDHSFGHCERVHARLVRCYAQAGHRLVPVPPGTPQARADQVLQVLAGGPDGPLAPPA